MDQVFLFAVIAAFVIIFQLLMVRWMFRINEQVTNQQATIWLLIKLCHQQGVPQEEIDKLKEHFGIR